MTNQETDTALILENELKRRVREVTRAELALTVHGIVKKELDKYKTEMMTEIILAVGKSLRVVDNEGRKPLWDTVPEDLGMSRQQFETFQTPEGSRETDITDALR